MSGVVFKQWYKSKNKPSTSVLNQKHVNYIATRPGAVHNPDCSFGLWGRLPGIPEPENINSLKLAKRTVGQASKAHTLWRAVFSVDKDTASRHDLYDRKTWEALLKKQIHILADQMSIKQKDFCWLASMHYEKGHPHVHVVYWDGSDAIHQEAMPQERFEIMAERVRAEFGREIYRDELKEIQAEQATEKDQLRLELRALLKEANLAEALDLSHVSTGARSELTASLADLAATVPTKGALKYAYIKKYPEYAAKLDAFISEVLKISDFQRVLKKYESDTQEVSFLYGNGKEKVAFELEAARKELYKNLGNEVLNTIKEYRKELMLKAPADRGDLQIVLHNTVSVIMTANPLYQELLAQMPRERTPTGELLKDEVFAGLLFKLTGQVANDIRVNTQLHGFVEANGGGLSKDELKEFRAETYRAARHDVTGLILDKLREDAGYPQQAQADIMTNLLIRLLGEASKNGGQRQAQRDLMRSRRELSKTAQKNRQAQLEQGGSWPGLEL